MISSSIIPAGEEDEQLLLLLMLELLVIRKGKDSIANEKHKLPLYKAMSQAWEQQNRQVNVELILRKQRHAWRGIA